MSDSRQERRSRFLSTTYEAFRHDARLAMFLRIAIFRNQNQPIDGYYFEFGCHTGRTMRLAFEAFDDLFEQIYVGFDSFEGLPAMSPEDKMPIWREGGLTTTEEAFRSIVTGHGLPSDRLITVKGFYEKTLTPELASRFLPTKAAVILVDCDLYASTVPVLDFIVPFLQRGTVLVFDDWFQFHGDPDRGQRRAFGEFREGRPELRFVDFFENGEVKALIVLDPGREEVPRS